MDAPIWQDYVRTALVPLPIIIIRIFQIRVCAEVLALLNCIFYVFVQQVSELRSQGLLAYAKNLVRMCYAKFEHFTTITGHKPNCPYAQLF